MLVVHVHVHVKPEFVDAFAAATVVNARNSVQEPGIARFDVIQAQDDPTHFVLVEVYRSQEATVAHKETGHYAAWRDAVGRGRGWKERAVRGRTALLRLAPELDVDELWG